METGFIGLGSLGAPIAMNLLEKGHSMIVYNRSPQKTGAFRQKGAVVSESIAELAERCDIIFTMVSDDAALFNVCEGPGGLIQHARPGSIHVSMSTILPATAEKITILQKQHHQVYVAAPVFGRPEAAVARKLNFIVSGHKDGRDRVKSHLEDAGGAGVWDFGDSIRAANTIKLCGNFLIAVALEAMGESIQLAEKGGVDPVKMWEMFNQTLFNTPMYHNYSRFILEKKYEPAAFTVKLGLKDMNLVLEQGMQSGAMVPLAGLLQEHLSRLVAEGKSQLDWSAISEALIS